MNKSEAKKIVEDVVRKHFVQIENPKEVDGAQMWNLQWWMPVSGCDTLEAMIEDMIWTMAKNKQ